MSQLGRDNGVRDGEEGEKRSKDGSEQERKILWEQRVANRDRSDRRRQGETIDKAGKIDVKTK